ncbi:OLC1v1032564C1 [Oldenlandia corymbosa var. corymbosa]|uniref:OLC1v1032564C1 n=1 Tax=Oldenlandia corymbosa var. corymbosa TaxID=529605 RepID=A0AAV1CPH5_OLDCO|nr:OLC1v1032564C1 [Oldenlandia corymbosa var. corymbosa]
MEHNLTLYGLSILLISFIVAYYLIKFLQEVWWKPMEIQHQLQSQGIKGPPYMFMDGNATEILERRRNSLSRKIQLFDDMFPTLQPHIHLWTKIYGKNFLHWPDARRAELVVTELELVQELLDDKEQSFSRPGVDTHLQKMIIGDGDFTSPGEKGAKFRKLADQAFHDTSLNNMIPSIVQCVDGMLGKWKQYEGKEIDIFEELWLLSAEVISKTAFGVSSVKGQLIFDIFRKLMSLDTENSQKVRFFPVISMIFKDDEMDKEAEKLGKQIRICCLEMVEKWHFKLAFEEKHCNGDDFLGLLMKDDIDSEATNKIPTEETISHFKVIYSAGQAKTSVLLSWTMLLLASHADWQEKAREEVIRLFGQETPNSEGISRLKTMSMIINESLRLYPPIVNAGRKAKKGTTLGKLILPANIDVHVPILAIHHDPKLWGKDAHVFNPERFSNGVSAATKDDPAAFLPFGLGRQTCVGADVASIEAKITLSMILQRYSFTLSPNYVHSPIDSLLLWPQHGIQYRRQWFLLETMAFLSSIFLCFFILVLVRIIYKCLWAPIRLQYLMSSQGIKGPPYKFIYGNTKEIFNMKTKSMSSPMDLSHDLLPRIQPHIHTWRKLYGKNFLIWGGIDPQLVITEPELIREIFSNKVGAYRKPKFDNFVKKLLGDGLVATEDLDKWLKLRKLANHAFHAESLKEMIPAMIESMEPVLEKWRTLKGKEIDVYEEFRHLTSEIISRTAFGSSYLEGKNIFDMMTQLGFYIFKNDGKVRFFKDRKYFQTADEIESDKIEQSLRETIMSIVKKREDGVKMAKTDDFGRDFLGSLLKVHHAAEIKSRISVDNIVDECKTFYLAGHETISSALTWTVLLLAIHTDWQEKARKEVFEVYGQENPKAECIPKLKNLTMIINETLRLYSPVHLFIRKVAKEVKLGELKLPADTSSMY